MFPNYSFRYSSCGPIAAFVTRSTILGHNRADDNRTWPNQVVVEVRGDNRVMVIVPDDNEIMDICDYSSQTNLAPSYRNYIRGTNNAEKIMVPVDDPESILSILDPNNRDETSRSRAIQEWVNS